jgi:choline dehydrogenase
VETCGYFPLLQRGARRGGAARDALEGTPGRERLTVRTRVEVDRVLLKRGRATGIECRDGTRVKARRTVVLCAGVFHSPLILLRSGIGPTGGCAAAGIEPVVDLPGVGENLRDHVRIPVLYASGRRSPARPARWLDAMVRYAVCGDGPMRSNCCEAGAFIAVSWRGQAPDVELITHFQTGLHPRAVDIECALLDTESRGTVRLDPANPQGPPLIDPCLLGAPREVEALAAAVQRVRSIAARPALRAFPLGDELLPGGHVRDAAAMEAFIRGHATTSYHPVGTCRMGNDHGAVVDAGLAVRGLEGLYVVDASVMPTLPAGHPSAIVYAIAEKAACLLAGKSRSTADE